MTPPAGRFTSFYQVTGRVGTGQEVSGISHGSGRVGSGDHHISRVGPGHPDRIRPSRGSGSAKSPESSVCLTVLPSSLTTRIIFCIQCSSCTFRFLFRRVVLVWCLFSVALSFLVVRHCSRCLPYAFSDATPKNFNNYLRNVITFSRSAKKNKQNIFSGVYYLCQGLVDFFSLVSC